MKTHFTVEVRGFNSGETDLRDYLARAPALETSPQLALIFEAAYEAIYDNPNNDKYCALLFVGHADRVPAGSEAQRRADEEKASYERADHARSWVLEMVNGLAQAYQNPPQAGWDQVENVSAFKVGVGAADLAEPPGTLPAAFQNRRVRMVVAGRNVSVIDQNNEGYFILSG